MNSLTERAVSFDATGAVKILADGKRRDERVTRVMSDYPRFKYLPKISDHDLVGS